MRSSYRTFLSSAGLALVMCSAAAGQNGVTMYSLNGHGGTASVGPNSITAGPDGALWFTEGDANRIGRITSAGVLTEYSAGLLVGAYALVITRGPDGAMWFTVIFRDQIGRIPTSVVQPAAQPVPALSPWLMLALAAMLAVAGWLGLRRRAVA